MARAQMYIGLAGCGNTSFKSIVYPAKFIDDIIAYGVSSRDYANAFNFSLKHGIKLAFRTYEELIGCPEIDTIYISLPNKLHAYYVEKALENNKNVLIEKPICLTNSEAVNIRKCFEQSSGKLLETIMVQHHPWQASIENMIHNKEYGNLLSISTTINYPIKENNAEDYRYNKSMGGGAFFDTASYWLQFLQRIVDLSSYSKLRIMANINSYGVDDDFKLEMVCNNDIYVKYATSFILPYKANHELVFDEAVVTIRNYDRAALGFAKVTITIKSQDIDKDNITFPPQNYYLNQLLFFKNILDRQLSAIYLEESIARVSLMNEFYAQINKKPL
jgi:NDP-hexose-3-ketoreductase